MKGEEGFKGRWSLGFQIGGLEGVGIRGWGGKGRSREGGKMVRRGKVNWIE